MDIRIAGTQLRNEGELSRKEWLVTNGIGGFAGSTLVGANARGYHSLLIAAFKPPLERILLVSKLDETVEAGGQEFVLASNMVRDEVQPKGYEYLAAFRYSFHPVFTYALEGRVLEKKIYMVYGENTTVVEYRYLEGADSLRLRLTPYLNYRDYHGNTQREDWPWDLTIEKNRYQFIAFPGAAPLYMTAQGEWKNAPRWVENLYYPVEAYRGLKDLEAHYIPGELVAVLKPGDVFTVIFSTQHTYDGNENTQILYQKQVERVEDLLENSRIRDVMSRRLVLAADQFIVQRSSTGTATVIAGYPWFTDWGRDSMIALPGLTMVTGRWREGREILQTFATYVRHGLIPNRFPDAGEEPEYNTVDASLWFFVACYEYYCHTHDVGFIREHLPLLKEMIRCHMDGTLWGIGMDFDGLLNQGEEGVQLTWMDAKVGNWVVTPRDGKAVEINALWYNAVKITAYLCQRLDESEERHEYEQLAQRILTNFQQVFWNDADGYLYDRISRAGEKDPTIRPNQIFALSLPFPLLDRTEGLRLMKVVQKHLYTPLGLRSLSPADIDYHSHYGGDQYHRDAAYHQGTVWGWLMGPYLEALLYVEKEPPQVKEKVLTLMEPLLAHLLSDGAIGQISEVFDGDLPHHHRGCYAQAWSVAELLRIREMILRSQE